MYQTTTFDPFNPLEVERQNWNPGWQFLEIRSLEKKKRLLSHECKFWDCAKPPPSAHSIGCRMRDKTRNQDGGLSDFWVKRVFLLTDRQVSTTRLGVLLFFYPNVKTSSIMPPDAGDPMVRTQKYERTQSQTHSSISRLGGFVFFYPNARTYMPPNAGNPLVKPKGTRAYHHGRICPYIFFWILEQWVRKFLFPLPN